MTGKQIQTTAVGNFLKFSFKREQRNEKLASDVSGTQRNYCSIFLKCFLKLGITSACYLYLNGNDPVESAGMTT